MKKNLTYVVLTTLMMIALAVVGITTHFWFGLIASYLAVGSIYATTLIIEAPEVLMPDAEVSAFGFYFFLVAAWIPYLLFVGSQRVIRLYRLDEEALDTPTH